MGKGDASGNIPSPLRDQPHNDVIWNRVCLAINQVVKRSWVREGLQCLSLDLPGISADYLLLQRQAPAHMLHAVHTPLIHATYTQA